MAKMWNIISVAAVVSGVLSGVAEAQVTKDNLDQNADQSQGNYAATNLNYLGGGGSLGMMQSAWKDPLQHMGEGQTRPGYTKYYWTPELVLPVRVREGMYTLINFPDWEIIENVYLGDGQSFNAEIQGPSSLMVYPDSSQFVGVDTNMIVFGRSGNKYVFYVQSETVNTDRITNAIIDIEVVKGHDGANGRTDALGGGSGHVNANSYSLAGSSKDATFTRDLQKEDWIEKIPVDPTQFRFDIEVYVPNPDDIIIAPERVWRDNIFTYIDLGDKALSAVQRPIVTLIVERSETPVGFRAAGPNNRLIIVEGMGDMVLRSGKRIVCLKLRRADSDGLENTVYAKTNEWDLQAPKNLKSESEEGGRNLEDVYGASSAQTTDKGSTPEKKSDADEKSFWKSLLFSPKEEETGNKGKDGETTASREQTATAAENVSADRPASASEILDSLPKTSPIVVNANKTAATENTTLSGQYDIKADGSELITPSYDDAKDVSVTYQQDKTQNVPAVTAAASVASEQNANPVLITPKKETDGSKAVVSAETEALLKEFRSRKSFNAADESNISIELGTDEDVNNLEKLWNDISRNYSAAIGRYQPFYSVDTAADGQGKELFHLRVGPVKSLEEGDNICSQLGRNGIFCSVVRIQ